MRIFLVPILLLLILVGLTIWSNVAELGNRELRVRESHDETVVVQSHGEVVREGTVEE